MTDKTEPTVIRGAKISFKPVRGYPADAQTRSYYAMSARIAAEIYQRWIDDNFDIRVISVCGYNPQKLLPAPSFERQFMQSVAEWAYAQMKKPITDPSWGGPGVGRLYPYQERAIEMLSRWNEPDADPLRDLQRGMHRLIGERIGVGSDLTKIELRYLKATLDFETAGRTPAGRIEIFDYEDGTVINLEGAGELPGLIDEDFWLNPRDRRRYSPLRMKPTVEPRKRQPAYLDHDPTKKHKRRKKR